MATISRLVTKKVSGRAAFFNADFADTQASFRPGDGLG